MSEYKPTKEYAKEIREELKVAFPGIKFSVRTQVYSMGSNITVNWTDGPTQTQVSNLIKKYEQVDYDEASGEILSGGNMYIFADRDFSTKNGWMAFRKIDLTGKEPKDIDLITIARSLMDYASAQNNFESLGYNDDEGSEVELTFRFDGTDRRQSQELLEALGYEVESNNNVMVARVKKEKK